jgi:hypothetical protein
VGGVGGHDRVPQVHVPEQLFYLGDLGGVIGDPDLADDHLLAVEHRGEELDLAVQDPAQPLAVDRDRGQQPVQPARVRQVPQPAADQVVQEVRPDRLDERADPGLAGGDDPPAQRVRDPAKSAQDVLGQVSGMIADLAEAPRPGQRARDGHRQDEGEQVAAPARPPGIGNPGKHFQQPGNPPAHAFIGAGHSGIAGMRDWHGGLSRRWDLDSTPMIQPDGRPLPRINGAPPACPARK